MIKRSNSKYAPWSRRKRYLEDSSNTFAKIDDFHKKWNLPLPLISHIFPNINMMTGPSNIRLKSVLWLRPIAFIPQHKYLFGLLGQQPHTAPSPWSVSVPSLPAFEEDLYAQLKSLQTTQLIIKSPMRKLQKWKKQKNTFCGDIHPN